MSEQSVHVCSEGGRFDRLERSLEAINLTLAKLSELLISSATDDIRIKILEERSADIEARVRVLEKIMAKNSWIERLVWVALVAVVAGYFKFNT